jgi:Domain of unknown function (DUF4383)
MASTAHSSRRTGPSPAQVFCGLVGLVLVVAGIVGFFANADFAGPDQRGELLGLDVNAWHNIVHIATGLLLLAGVPSAAGARVICGIFGVTYALVAVLGIIDGSDVLGLIPIDGADNVLHAVLAVLALVAAAAPAPSREAHHEDETRSRAERYPIAYDASSPNQVFVGVRSSGS